MSMPGGFGEAQEMDGELQEVLQSVRSEVEEVRVI